MLLRATCLRVGGIELLVAGVEIRGDKPLWVALAAIYGVGYRLGRRLALYAGVDPEMRAGGLNRAQVLRLEMAIRGNAEVGGALRLQVRNDIKRLKDIGCYRGLRHRRGLPVRGQRTHSNARTRRHPGWGRRRWGRPPTLLPPAPPD